MKNIVKKIEAVGEFPFTFYIEKAIPEEEDEELILEGIASTTNVDHDKERMSKDALLSMEAAINKDGVPLRVEHQHEGSAIIGKVFKAWVDERDQLHIKARLDRNHPVSPILHHSMKSGTKMGLSVGGIVKRAVKEFVESVGGVVKTFYDVALQEVSVTPRPANYDSWLVAKSIADNIKDAENYSENVQLRKEFLFENSQLDYLQAFAKSVPDKAWRKVDPSEINKDNKIMDPIKKETGTEDMDEDTNKSVSRSEFNALEKGLKTLTSMMSKGFENIGSILNKAMDGEPKDATNPDKKKDEDESPTAKALDSEPMDQNHPDKPKPDEEEEVKAKTASEADGTDENGEREKKKSATKKKADSNEEYDIETVERSINTLENLHKRLTGTKKASSDEKIDEETTKAGDETTLEEEMATSKAHPLDLFVATMTKTMEAMVNRVEKGGKRILGFEKSFTDQLQRDPEFQAELLKLLKIPGFKKSVAMGVPYMATKDGSRFALMPVQARVQKSVDEDAPKNFKDLYKQRYSSVEDTQE